jgi:hypothetical protein
MQRGDLVGHPDRKTQREKKKQAKEEMLGRKSLFNILDLTPYNAIGNLKQKAFEIKFK